MNVRFLFAGERLVSVSARNEATSIIDPASIVSGAKSDACTLPQFGLYQHASRS
jgi:hypothetical protein